MNNGDNSERTFRNKKLFNIERFQMRIENENNIEEGHFIPSSFYWTVGMNSLNLRQSYRFIISLCSSIELIFNHKSQSTYSIVNKFGQ